MSINKNNIWDKFGTLFILLAMVLVVGCLSPKYFLASDNLVQIIVQSSITILIACGEFFAILIAGIDLSVGATLGFCGMIAGDLLVNHVPLPVCIIAVILIGALIGCINGALINWTSLHPFIITLGTQSIIFGLTLIISDAKSVYGFPTSFTKGFAGSLGVIPVPIIIALVVALILAFVTMKTKFGRNLYALGGNAQAAWYSGIDTKLHTLSVYMISGICAALAGLIMDARLGAADPNAGDGYETMAIAAAIIGGTSFFGGKGKISGVVIGALIIGVINNSLNILNISTFYQKVAMGLLIIIAVTVDKFIGDAKK